MLEDLKLLLGLEDTDKKTEQQLQLILNATKQRLKFLLGGLEPPLRSVFQESVYPLHQRRCRRWHPGTHRISADP